MARPHVQRGVSLSAFTPDTFDLLDTKRMLDDIEAETGETLFTNFSVLSPALQRKQMETGLGITLTNYSELSPVQLCAEVAVATASDGAPNWVPANAKIYIDLIAPGRAWTEDDGEVAIDTLLGTDANTENAWGSTEYDPAGLGEHGFTYPNVPPAFIGLLRDDFLAGGTLVLRVNQIVGSSNFTLVVAATDGNDAIELDFTPNNGDFEASSWNGSATLAIQDILNKIDSGVGPVNVAAITLVSDRLDVAINGSSAVSTALDQSDRPTGNPFSAVIIDAEAQAVASITIYDALPSTAGLSALSETGVTNTAPIVVDPNFWNSTFSMADIAGMGDPPIIGLVALNGGGLNLDWVSDPEGNPMSLSFVSGEAGFSVGDSAGDSVLFFDFSGKGTGDYHFTLRATDPGGLYVEQQFTITVTTPTTALSNLTAVVSEVDGFVEISVDTDGNAGLVSWIFTPVLATPTSTQVNSLQNANGASAFGQQNPITAIGTKLLTRLQASGFGFGPGDYKVFATLYPDGNPVLAAAVTL